MIAICYTDFTNSLRRYFLAKRCNGPIARYPTAAFFIAIE
jgi:hypothetical protein